jgi:hypothetical protein
MPGHRRGCCNPGETRTGTRNGTPGGRGKPVKFKRVYPGYYEAWAWTTMAGKPVKLFIEIRRFDEWDGPQWSTQISTGRNVHPLLDFGDGYGPWTYREAKEGVAHTLKSGLAHSPWGWHIASA